MNFWIFEDAFWRKSLRFWQILLTNWLKNDKNGKSPTKNGGGQNCHGCICQKKDINIRNHNYCRMKILGLIKYDIGNIQVWGVLGYFIDIALPKYFTIYYLNSHCIIHRDMKPQNILISTNGIVKLCVCTWVILAFKGQFQQILLIS